MPVNLAYLERDAAALVEAALKAGADACDVVVSSGRSLGVSVREGKVENTSRSESDDFSLRVFCGKRSASINANTIGDRKVLAERAVAMAKVSPEDAFQGLAPREKLASSIPDLDLMDTEEASAESLAERARACEAAGLAVPGVTRSTSAGAGWGISGFVLATSTGFTGSYSVSRFSTSASMVAGEGIGMERDYDFHSATHLEDLMAAEKIGQHAGEGAVRRLNPRQAQTGAAPVVIDRRAATGIMGALTGAINGAAVARKTSFLKEKLHQQVANASVTIIDNPLRKRGLASRSFDGEGMPVAAMNLVENGVLKTWTLDWAAARELGLESNARAVRGGSGTSPSTSNCHIAPGALSLEQMLKQMGTGLYLTETIGHGVNMVTGDYSKGASGFWVENGEIAFPVAGITIAGNLKDIFMSMQPANDLEFRSGSNSPSLLVEGFTIGGK